MMHIVGLHRSNTLAEKWLDYHQTHSYWPHLGTALDLSATIMIKGEEHTSWQSQKALPGDSDIRLLTR